MPVSWKPSTPDEHAAIARKTSRKVDPEWEARLDELARGNTVRVEYTDPAERIGLARTIGRRASTRGFKVDIRHGDGYLSVQRTEDHEAAKRQKAR